MSGQDTGERSLSTVESELYFLIAKFLSNGPCSEAAKVLKREIAEQELLPKRFDWLGNQHPTDYDDFTRSNPHIPEGFLHKICTRIGSILDREVKPSVCGVQSLLGAGRQSLLRTPQDNHDYVSSLRKFLNSTKFLSTPPATSSHCLPPNIALTIQSRQVVSNNGKSHLLPCQFYSSNHLLCRTLGHLSSVYCILFDTAGFFIFTGADDNLVKIWMKNEGRLRATLRGHSAEITDMDVNVESTLLASASCDKIIRLWCLQTTAPLVVLTGHTGMITSLKFCPSAKSNTRYLSSTGNDGCVLFWQYNNSSRTFNPRPIKYVERTRSGAQMICSSYSPGGMFLATGSADHHVRIYLLNHDNPPEKIFEIEAHLDRVDSLQFAKNSYQFVSGSKDGTAKIWRYERQHWRSLTLQMSTKSKTCSEENCQKLQVTMVGWNLNDYYVITAVNTHVLKTWNAFTGDLVYVLKGHEDEVFVLESHPSDERVILSAGHDGKVILWDLTTGSCIKTFNNLIEGHGHGAVFDCRFSPDGSVFASTDSHGHVSIFGMGSNEAYKQIPDQQFFHTDYRPLIRDANHHVLDEQTQQAPHLMPPPFLVDIDGNPYPPDIQRLVPGRERCNNDQLIPYIAVSAGGEAEVLQPIRPHDSVEQGNQIAAQNAGDPNIDDMIEIFQAQSRNQDDEQPAPSNDVAARPNGNPALSPGLAGMRRDGDVEGVRQSHGNWQSRDRQGEMLAWTKRCVVKKVDALRLAHLTDQILAKGENEFQHYTTQKKKRPIPQQTQIKIDDRISRRIRRRNARQHNYNVRSREPDEEPSVVNRNNTMTSSGRVTRQAQYIANEYENPDDVVLSSDNTSGSTNRGTTAEGTWSSSSSSSSSSDSVSATDSDWEEEPRKKKPQNERSGTRRQPKRGENENDDHSYVNRNDIPSDTSSEKPKKVEIEKKKSPSKPKRQKNKAISMKAQCRWTFMDLKKSIRAQLPGGLKELPDKFKPPEWLTDVIPKKTPYQPQIGDELMYFPQGHKCYFAAVKRVKKYEINIKHQPWTKIKLREQEIVKVVAVKYEIKPPHLCCLKLALLDSATGKSTGETFTVKYHDMPDVIDFFVLRKYYSAAMDRNWKPGDRFRSVIDDAWWIGTIESQEPFEAEYPDSMFQCFNVKWDNGEKEKMSPWDLEMIDENRIPEHRGGGVPVLPSETSALLYHPDKDEWPPCGREVECDRLARGLEFIMDLAIAEPFNAPVDLNAYPLYAVVIQYPIDLSTIKSRIENRYYRRSKCILFDVKYIENDANLFNEPGTPIVKKAKMVTELLKKFIEDPNCEDLMALYQEISESHHLKDHEAVSVDISESNSDDSAQNCGGHYLRGRRNKISNRKKEAPNSHITSKSWKQECHDLLGRLFDCEDSTPFRFPVNRFEYPDYHRIIDNPTDLTTIKEKLNDGAYQDPTKLCAEVRLLFENSKNFNTNKKSRIYSMTIRLSAVFEEHFKGILNDWNYAVRQERYYKLNNRRLNSRSMRRKISECGDEPSTSQRQLRRNTKKIIPNGFKSYSSDEFEENQRVSPEKKSSSSDSSDSSSSSSNDTDSDKSESEKEDDLHHNRHSKTAQSRKLAESSEHHSSSRLSSTMGDTSDDDYDEATKKAAAKQKPGVVCTSLSDGSDENSAKSSENEEDDKSNSLSDGSDSKLLDSTQEEKSENSSSDSESDEPATQRKTNRNNTKDSESKKIVLNSNGQSGSGSSALDNNSESNSNSSSSELDDEIAKPKAPMQTTRRSIRTRNQKVDNINHRKTTRRRKRSESDEGLSVFAKVPKKRMTTRNRGKRTVIYQEDSDFEYYGHNKSDLNNDDDDENDDRRPITSVSSRGRIRKLTPLGRAMIFD